MKVGQLPPHLAQTMFAKPTTYPLAMRYSSEPGDPGLDDRIPQPRGLGMKIFNVQGKRLEGAIDIPVQDLEFNNCAVLELSDAKTSYEIIDLRIKYGHDPALLSQHLAKRNDTKLQEGRNHLPNVHAAGMIQWSQSAYRFGNYVAKFRLVPSSETQKRLKDQYVKKEHKTNQLRDWLQEYYKSNDAVYLLQAQLLEKIEDQPIENSGVEWPEDKYPYQTIAEVHIPAQDSFNNKRRTEWEDHYTLSPYLHSLEGLKPLGGINRVRKAVYPASRKFRAEKNAREVVSIKNITEIPA